MAVFYNVFDEIAALLLIAARYGAVAVRLHQALIVAFVVGGILVWPAGFDWVHSADQLDLLAKMGIALLLFRVGLRLDLQPIRSPRHMAATATTVDEKAVLEQTGLISYISPMLMQLNGPSRCSHHRCWRPLNRGRATHMVPMRFLLK